MRMRTFKTILPWIAVIAAAVIVWLAISIIPAPPVTQIGEAKAIDLRQCVYAIALVGGVLLIVQKQLHKQDKTVK